MATLEDYENISNDIEYFLSFRRYIYMYYEIRQKFQ